MQPNLFNDERRHTIGILDMDLEPGLFPALWDLSDLPRKPERWLNWTEFKPVQYSSLPAESVIIEQPVSQLVDFYDMIISPSLWKWCGH